MSTHISAHISALVIYGVILSALIGHASSTLVSMLISFGAVDTFLTSTNSSQYEILATHSSERGFLFYEGTTL
jgi:hypothetical protein